VVLLQPGTALLQNRQLRARGTRGKTSISKISAKKEPQSAYRPRVRRSGEVHDLCQVE